MNLWRTFFDDVSGDLRIDDLLLFGLLEDNAPNSKMFKTIILALNLTFSNLSLSLLCDFIHPDILIDLHFE